MMVTKKNAAADVNVLLKINKINRFAQNTSRTTELKEEIAAKKKQLKNLEDASEDSMLTDDCLMIPYPIGDVCINQEETQEVLEEAKKI